MNSHLIPFLSRTAGRSSKGRRYQSENLKLDILALIFPSVISFGVDYSCVSDG